MEMIKENEAVDSIDLKAAIYDTINESVNKIIYEGEINQSILLAFAKLTEQKLERNDENSTVIKKVFHVIVECLQNICKHSEEAGGDYNGLFLVSENASAYAITTGNYITNEKGDRLKSILDFINALSKEEIKEMYIKQMKEGAISDKGGAGLGFLDMAKKTGNKFQYHISSAENKKLFFILKIIVSKK